MQVVSVLAKKPAVLRLIGVDPEACSEKTVVPALQRAARTCSADFLAVVAELQTLEEAVATALVRGRHPLLRGDPRIAAPPLDEASRSKEGSAVQTATASTNASEGYMVRSAATKSVSTTVQGPSGMLGQSVGVSMMAIGDTTAEGTSTFVSNKATPASVQRFAGGIDVTDTSLVHSTTLHTTKERTTSPVRKGGDAASPRATSPAGQKAPPAGAPMGLSLADDALKDGRRGGPALDVRSPLMFPQLPLVREAQRAKLIGDSQPAGQAAQWRAGDQGSPLLLRHR